MVPFGMFAALVRHRARTLPSQPEFVRADLRVVEGDADALLQLFEVRVTGVGCCWPRRSIRCRRSGYAMACSRSS